MLNVVVFEMIKCEFKPKVGHLVQLLYNVTKVDRGEFLLLVRKFIV